MDHETRFKYIIEQILPNLADIVTLNEVTYEFINVLNKYHFQYHISDIKSKRGLNSLILSRFPFEVILNDK